MLEKVLGYFGLERKGAQRTPAVRVVRARHDAASNSLENQKLWAGADGLSANESTTPEGRETLRNRARKESENNGYVDGIITTYADDVVGTGPVLQMKLDDPKLNEIIEQAWADWADATDFNGKLHTMFLGQVRDGDGFGLLVTNPKVRHAVTLDLRLVEPEHVASPYTGLADPNEYDGIIYDEYLNPLKYRVLYAKPNGMAFALPSDYRLVDAEHVIHMYRPRRSTQSRGSSEIAPGLNLFAKLRRFTNAVLGAAETAADFAGVVETDVPPNGEAVQIDALDTIELESRTLLTLPAGWKMGQVDAKQPTTTFGAFKRELVNEGARPLGMPFNVAACDSSGYNYSSGKLDHQKYDKRIKVRQDRVRAQALDSKVLPAFLRELVRVDARIPKSLADTMNVPHEWFWPGSDNIDPVKEAAAQDIKLRNGTTSLAKEMAKEGRDWEDHLDEVAREEASRAKRGLPSIFAGALPTKSKDEEDEEPVGTGKKGGHEEA